MNSDQAAIQKALDNNWEEAINLNQEILLERPSDTNVLNRLTHALIQAKKLKNASKICQKVLDLDNNNPIAIKHQEKIKVLEKDGCQFCFEKNCHTIKLIEEPGKSKVIPLVRPGDSQTLSLLQSCLELDIKFRQQGICFYYQNKYIGKLPDDIAKRLIWLSKRDNRYQAFLKSIGKNKVSIFIKETKQSRRNQNYPSFAS